MNAARKKVVAATEKEEDGGTQPDTKKKQMKAKVDEAIRQAQQSDAAAQTERTSDIGSSRRID